MNKNEEIDPLDPEFFSQDIEEFNSHIEKNETLYNKINTKLDSISSMSGLKTNMKSFGINSEICELGNTLSRIRTSSIDATHKRMQAKKAVADIQLKAKDQQIAQSKNNELAREALSLIQSSQDQRNNLSLSVKLPNNQDQKQLREEIDKKLSSGEISLTKNDRAMKHDFNGIDYALASDRSTIIVKDSNGGIIEDYPNERIPNMNVVKIENGNATMSNGAVIPVEK